MTPCSRLRQYDGVKCQVVNEPFVIHLNPVGTVELLVQVVHRFVRSMSALKIGIGIRCGYIIFFGTHSTTVLLLLETRVQSNLWSSQFSLNLREEAYRPKPLFIGSTELVDLTE